MEYQFGLFIAEVICIKFGYFVISRPAHGRLDVSLNETNSSDYGTYLMFDTKIKPRKVKWVKKIYKGLKIMRSK